MQLSDAQVMTLAVAIVVLLSLLIYSNSRITDAKETLRAEMNAMRAELSADFGGLRAEMRAGFERIENLLRIHELEHHR